MVPHPVTKPGTYFGHIPKAAEPQPNDCHAGAERPQSSEISFSATSAPRREILKARASRAPMTTEDLGMCPKQLRDLAGLV